MSNIQKCELTFDMKEWDVISPEAISLLRKLLVKDPKKRFTAKEALDHPWFEAKIENKNAHTLDPGIMQRL